MRPNCWTLDYPIASLHLPEFCARLNLAHQAHGLYDVQLRNLALASSALLRLHIPSLAEDSSEILGNANDGNYVRGNDLVATYGGTGDEPVKWTVYWRAEHGTASLLTALNVFVSVETSLLDSHPMIEISTCIPAGEVLLVHANHSGTDLIAYQPLANSTATNEPSNCLLFRLPGSEWSYAEMAHPSDLLSLTTQGDGSPHWHLFGQFLEKGVIRRARMRGVFLPRNNDIELAADCCRTFSADEAPLTA